MKRVSRVLCAVAIDDSDKHVFEHALVLARRHGATLLLLHAASPQVSLNREATQRLAFLRQLRARAEATGVDIWLTVQTGRVDDIILQHARSKMVDFIVLGTTRHETRRGLSRWIAERVLRDAPCPTLVVPRTAGPPESLTDAILCAVDFSTASVAAVQEAVRLSEPGSRPVTLLHVVDRRGASELPIRSWTREGDRGPGTALTKLRLLVPSPQRATIFERVSVGRPAPEIARAAQTMNAGLIIIGASRRNWIGSKLFATTKELLRDATCPVLAVPASAFAQQRTEHVNTVAA